MARKTATPVMTAPVPVREKHYADYPACLPRYKWAVEDALRAPERMFNSPTAQGTNAHYCKVCGAAYRKQDFAAHVNEHAEQLLLTRRVGTTKIGDYTRTEVVKVTINEELKLTIIDSLSERLPDLQLKFTLNYGLLGDKVARTINSVSKDGGASVPRLCVDCDAL